MTKTSAARLIDAPSPNPTLTVVDPPKKTFDIKAIMIALIGTIVEYYDYALYGFCAAIIAQHFFSGSEGNTALFKTFAIFATGSVAKPIGALFFGYIGDYYGRRVALKISMLGIAVPTTIIGLVPGDASWGGWAAAILLLCRFAQGFFVAGESDGVRIFLHESLPKHRSNLANAMITLAALVGAYIATLAGAAVARDSSNWQTPFLIGGAMGFIVLFMRHFISETPDYEDSKVEASKSPWWTVFSSDNILAVVASMMMAGAVGGVYHYYFVFWSNYISKVLGYVDGATAAQYASNGVLVFALATPIAGLCSDRFGGERMFYIAAAILTGMFGLNVWFTLEGIASPLLMLSTAFCLAFMYNPAYPIMIKQFKVVERYRCISFGHAVGSMLFSGSAPAICMGLIHATGNKFTALIYFAILLILAYGGITLVRVAAAQKIQKGRLNVT